jgi:hypothetical protein
MNLKPLTRILATQTRRAPIYAVFGVAAWQSYWHIVEVATKYGETESAYIIPLSLDGLLLLSQRYLTTAPSRPTRALAASIYALCLVATLVANMAAAQPTPGGRIVAAWPALSMAGASLLIHLWPAAQAKRQAKQAQQAKAERSQRAKAAAETRRRNKQQALTPSLAHS